MDPHNLQTASTYINNLLLARGLLKNGKAIDFVRPENGAGTDATMGKIINLINDLVLRRDREAEHRENLASTIHNLRTSESQQTLEIERLRTRNSDLSRSLALAGSQQRAFKPHLASAEATIRQLREQVQRMKITIQQVRAQCANDIRKRDVEMQKLKAHLTDRQRGKREGLGVTTININPAPERTPKSRSTPSGPDVNNPGYTLKQETTEFLTELCQNLSDENDSLISLARTTIQTLRELQGISDPTHDDSSSLGASMSFLTGGQGPVDSLPTSVEDLSTNMDSVLDHLRTLLTNPSFVPLEEVEMREEEIMRLREGWEKMEMRWKQAVTMIDGWQKRISDGGDSVNIDELRKGMSMDSGLGRSAPLSSADVNANSPIFGDDDQLEHDEDMSDGHESETRAKILKPTLSKPPVRALGERNGNVKSKSSPRKVSFHTEPTPDDEREEDEAVLVKAHASESVTQRSSRRRTSTKIPRQANPGPEISVKEKLNAVEVEARAAAEEIANQESKKRSRSRRDPELRSKFKGRRRSTLTNEELDQLLGVAE